MKKNVIVFGDLPIATKIVMFLQTIPEVDLGVVIGNENPHNNDPWKEIPLLFDYCVSNNIKRYSLDELENNFDDEELTLGLSCRFSRIIKKPLIKKFKNGIINMHGGILPEFAGLFSANMTVIKGSAVGGGTLHYIDEGIDTGEIIRSCSFEVTDEDTAYSVFQKTQEALADNLIEIIPSALEGYIEGKSQKTLLDEGRVANYYNRDSLEEFRYIDINKLTKEEVYRRIRGFDFPGYEPSYILDTNGRKIYLRYNY